MNLDARIQAFLTEVVKRLVDTPEEASVEVVDGRRSTCFRISVPANERGQVIGRAGSTIKSLRALVSLSASKHRRRLDVEIVD